MINGNNHRGKRSRKGIIKQEKRKQQHDFTKIHGLTFYDDLINETVQREYGCADIADRPRIYTDPGEVLYDSCGHGTLDRVK